MWWSKGQRDDIFWRTAGSGGRATSRQKIGKKTYGQQGDVQAVDPIGAPLTRLVTIEAKRGHKDAHIGDVMDRTNDHKLRWLEVFIKQSIKEAKDGGTPYWLLIIKRDNRKALVYMPDDLMDGLESTFENLKGAALFRLFPAALFSPPLREGSLPICHVFCTTLEKFLGFIRPRNIKLLEREVNAV